jgi:hypothetical protein
MEDLCLDLVISTRTAKHTKKCYVFTFVNYRSVDNVTVCAERNEMVISLYFAQRT